MHPHLAAAYPPMAMEGMSRNALEGCPLVFAALPHGESQKIAPSILASGAKFVDLGADFRLREASDYERWYGEAHTAPDLLE